MVSLVSYKVILIMIFMYIINEKDKYSVANHYRYLVPTKEYTLFTAKIITLCYMLLYLLETV